MKTARWQCSPLEGTVYPNGAWQDDLALVVCDQWAEAELYHALLVQLREFQRGDKEPREGQPARMGDRIVVSRDGVTGEIFRAMTVIGSAVALHSTLDLALAYAKEIRRREQRRAA